MLDQSDGTAADGRATIRSVVDLNRLAHRLVHEATEGAEEPSKAQSNGHLGGVKGGPARAAQLTPERRSEIARKAAAARWGKSAPSEP